MGFTRCLNCLSISITCERSCSWLLKFILRRIRSFNLLSNVDQHFLNSVFVSIALVQVHLGLTSVEFIARGYFRFLKNLIFSFSKKTIDFLDHAINRWRVFFTPFITKILQNCKSIFSGLKLLDGSDSISHKVTISEVGLDIYLNKSK